MTAYSTTLNIDGMHCVSCANKIRAALLRIEAITDAEVSPQSGSAEITSRAEVEEALIKDAVASAGEYSVKAIDHAGISEGTSTGGTSSDPITTAAETPKESLYPLFLIVGFISGVAILIAVATGTWAIESMMRHFMAGFFIVFSFFKLLDPPGFVSAYRGYDLIARKVPVWGWAYPFVELGLGIAYLLAWAPLITNGVTLVLMLIGAAGVLKALLDRRAIRCACLGTALNLPMTKVTLVEDLTMAAMAGAMITVILSSANS